MNHYSYGAVSRWFFEYLGGIRVFDSKPGLKELVIKPTVIRQIGSFEARYKSDYGIIDTRWKVDKNNAEIRISVPKSCKAKVLLPDGKTEFCGEGKYIFNCAVK